MSSNRAVAPCAKNTLRAARDLAVEFFARCRVAGTKEDFVFAAVAVKECKARRVAVNELTRKIERRTEAGAQTRRADALRTDDRILLEHDRFDALARSFTSRCCTSRPGADHEKLGLLHHVEVLGGGGENTLRRHEPSGSP